MLGAAALVLLTRGFEVLPAVLIVVAVVVTPYAIVFLPWLVWIRPRTVVPLAKYVWE